MGIYREKIRSIVRFHIGSRSERRLTIASVQVNCEIRYHTQKKYSSKPQLFTNLLSFAKPLTILSHPTPRF